MKAIWGLFGQKNTENDQKIRVEKYLMKGTVQMKGDKRQRDYMEIFISAPYNIYFNQAGIVGTASQRRNQNTPTETTWLDKALIPLLQDVTNTFKQVDEAKKRLKESPEFKAVVAQLTAQQALVAYEENILLENACVNQVSSENTVTALKYSLSTFDGRRTGTHIEVYIPSHHILFDQNGFVTRHDAPNNKCPSYSLNKRVANDHICPTMIVELSQTLVDQIKDMMELIEKAATQEMEISENEQLKDVLKIYTNTPAIQARSNAPYMQR